MARRRASRGCRPPAMTSMAAPKPRVASRARADAASVGMPLDGGDRAAHGGQDGRLVAGAGPDLEDPVTGPRREQLGHPRDHVRLADRLAGLDGESLIVVGARPVRGLDERLPRHLAHRSQDPLVADAAAAQLLRDHPRPGPAA